jgi:hypothetical protein
VRDDYQQYYRMFQRTFFLKKWGALKNSHRLLLLASAVWACFVVWQWWLYHIRSFSGLLNVQFAMLTWTQTISWIWHIGIPSLAPYILPSSIILFLFCWLRFLKRMKCVEVPFSFFIGMMLFLALVWSVFLTTDYFRSIENVEPDAMMQTLANDQSGFLMPLLTLMFSAVIVSLSAYYWGRFIISLLGREQRLKEVSDGLLFRLSAIAAGVIVLIFLLFAAGLAGILHPIVIATLFLMGGAVRWKDVISDIRMFFRIRTVVMPVRFVRIVIVTAIMLFFAGAVIDLTRNLPRGFDANTFYYMKIKLMAERQALVPGGTPLPFELIAASLRILFNDPVAMFGISLAGLSWGAMAVFGAVRSLLSSKNAGYFAMAVWLSMSVVNDIATIQSKPDILMVFFAFLSMWIFFLCFRRHFLAITLLPFVAGLLGMAVSIKLTALFLVIAMVVGMLAGMTGWGGTFRPHRSIMLHSLAWFVVPLLPWIILAFVTKGPSMPSSVMEMFSSVDSEQATISDMQWSALGIDRARCADSGSAEDFSRFYDTDMPYIVRILRAPWDVTMNSYVNSLALEFGCLFLALLPMAIFVVSREVFLGKEKHFWRILSIMGVTYLFVWSVSAHGVTWYGLSGMLLLLLPIAALAIRIPHQRLIVQSVFVFVLLVHFTYSFVVRAQLIEFWVTMRNVTGELSDDQAIASQYSWSYVQAIRLIDADPHVKVFASPAITQYYMKDADRKLYVNQNFDSFDCLYIERDPDLTLQRLKDLGFRYVLYNFTTGIFRKNAASDGVFKKAEAFDAFARKKLDLVIGTDQSVFRVYKIPE